MNPGIVDRVVVLLIVSHSVAVSVCVVGVKTVDTSGVMIVEVLGMAVSSIVIIVEKVMAVLGTWDTICVP
jgi:hypothetical protein